MKYYNLEKMIDEMIDCANNVNNMQHFNHMKDFYFDNWIDVFDFPFVYNLPTTHKKYKTNTNTSQTTTQNKKTCNCGCENKEHECHCKKHKVNKCLNNSTTDNTLSDNDFFLHTRTKEELVELIEFNNLTCCVNVKDATRQEMIHVLKTHNYIIPNNTPSFLDETLDMSDDSENNNDNCHEQLAYKISTLLKKNSQLRKEVLNLLGHND